MLTCMNYKYVCLPKASQGQLYMQSCHKRHVVTPIDLQPPMKPVVRCALHRVGIRQVQIHGEQRSEADEALRHLVDVAGETPW